MELLGNKAIKKSDLGYNNVLFGGTLMAWVDELAYSMSTRICNHTKMLSKYVECNFMKPVEEGENLRIYGKEISRSKTSIKLNIQVYSTNQLVFLSNLVFVKVSESGIPIPLELHVSKL